MRDDSIMSEQSDLIIASFVPLLLRKQFQKNPAREIVPELLGDQAVLLWIDICSFSPLSNRLLQENVQGVERLSRILQSHYEPILNTIIQFGGEPMIFAGDGVLAAWPCSIPEIKIKIKNAAACAQTILAGKGVTDDLGKPLSLHTIVACGECKLIELGGIDGRWLYSLLGEALTDLRLTSKNYEPGKVLISKNTLNGFAEDIRHIPTAYEASVLDQIIDTMPETAGPTLFLPEQAINTLRLYAPQPLSYKLDFEHIRWIDELRPVTVVFTQLHNFEPEKPDAAERLQKAVRITMPIVIKNEGILSQVWVDEKAANLLIFFGPPPAAHKDNPVRALRTATQIREALTAAGIINFTGVSTGKAFCGILGNDMLRQYTVIGDVVNLGAGLAQLQCGNVCCDEPTMKASRSEFIYGAPVMVNMKGEAAMIPVWAPVTGKTAPDNQQLDIPVIGRNTELSLFLDCVAKISAGERIALVLEGDSGLGKSKLLYDFKLRVEDKGLPVFTGAGDPVERGIPYSAWRSVFSTLIGLDGIAGHKERQNCAIEFLGVEYAEYACLLNAVLSLDLADSETVKLLSGKQRAEETKNLFLKLIRRSAAMRPLTFIIDDAHWMDEASWHLAVEIASSVNGCFQLFAVQSMEGLSEVQPLMNAGARHYLLQGLSELEQEELICTALGTQQVPGEISAPISGLAKGNPYFCLELTQAMLDTGAITIHEGNCLLAEGFSMDDFKLPETIQGAVRRRIDSLDYGPDLALKVASVAGQRFSINVVQNIFPIRKEKVFVPAHLKKNNHVGLIIRETVDNAAGYSFNNAITREVAYDMMLFEQKQLLHFEIAEWYEINFSENLTPFFARLAFHWERAGHFNKAAGYLEKESIHLFSIGFAKQSVDIGLRAVALLGTDIERNPKNIGPKIGENMGAIQALMAGQAPADLVNLNQLDDPKIEMALKMLLGIGPFAFQSQQIELFALISVTCLRMTLENGNGQVAADVYSMYSSVHRAMTGDRGGAYAWSQLALDLDKKNKETLFSRVAFVHTWFHNHWANHFSASLPLAITAAEKGFTAGDVLFACFNLSGYVVYLTACGRPLPEVMEAARKNIALNKKMVMNAAFHLVLELQFAKALAGETEHPLSFTDETYSEEADIASICDTEFGNQVGYYLVAKLKIHTHFGDWQKALEWAAHATQLIKAIEGQVAEVDLVQFHAVAAITGALKTGGEEAEQLIAAANISVETMRNWAAICPINFKHKSLMLEALMESATGDMVVAAKLFEQALALSEAGGFLNDTALLHECHLTAQFHKNKSLTALHPALAAYKKWGATGKVKYLEELYKI